MIALGLSSLFLACFLVFSFLVLFIFTGGLQKTKFLATIPRVEMLCHTFFGGPGCFRAVLFGPCAILALCACTKNERNRKSRAQFLKAAAAASKGNSRTTKEATACVQTSG